MWVEPLPNDIISKTPSKDLWRFPTSRAPRDQPCATGSSVKTPISIQYETPKVKEWYHALFEYFVDDFNRLLEDLATLRVVQRASPDVAYNHRVDIERRRIAILFHFFPNSVGHGNGLLSNADSCSGARPRKGLPHMGRSWPVERRLLGSIVNLLETPRTTKTFAKGQSRVRLTSNIK